MAHFKTWARSSSPKDGEFSHRDDPEQLPLLTFFPRDRANIRFADVEGSGRADRIHLDKYTGAATIFKNNGRSGAGSSSSFSWTNRGVLYNPIDCGETMVSPMPSVRFSKSVVLGGIS
jgi:hypothetical protein